tara:strand:+ start:148 stop:327 length:180 start_codon:yes stop_codon:yes gene_type:complete
MICVNDVVKNKFQNKLFNLFKDINFKYSTAAVKSNDGGVEHKHFFPSRGVRIVAVFTFI